MKKIVLIISLFVSVFIFFIKNNLYRDVKPKFATLSINSRVFDDDLILVHRNVEHNFAVIKKYILDNGVKQEELKLSPIKIIDNKDIEPIPMYFETVKTKGRFEAIVKIIIHSNNIDLLKKLQDKMLYKYVNEGKVEKELEGVNIFAYEREQDGDLLIYNKDNKVINRNF